MPSAARWREIDVEGLLGHQVHGRGRAAKGVEHEDIEALRIARLQLPLEHQPPVAEQDVGLGLAVFHEGEVAVDQVEHAPD